MGRRSMTMAAAVASAALGCVTVDVRVAGAPGRDGDASMDLATPGDTAGDPRAETEAAEPISVAIVFEARVREEAFACGRTYSGLGTAGSPWEALDGRLYVHDVRLVHDGEEVPVDLDQDGKWQYRNVALLDFEDRSGACANGTVDVNDTLHGTVRKGSYEGLRFRVGVPVELNHLDVSLAPSPLNLSALYWGWTNGYKFARLDGRSGDQAFHFHLASIQCRKAAEGVPATCSRLDVAEVELAGKDPTTTPVVLDLAALFAGANLGQNTVDTSPGCESAPTDPDCVPLFEALGLDFEDGTSDPARQTVFRW